MSGLQQATVTLDQEQYNRLNASEAQLRVMHSNMPELLRRVQDEAAKESQAMLQPLEERNCQFAASLDNLQGEARRFQLEAARRLAQQQTDFVQSLEHVRGEVEHLARATSQRFDAERREFNGKLQQQRHEIDEEIHWVENRVGDLETRERRRTELARMWLAAAQNAHDNIADNPRHEQFAPGKLARQANELQLASDALPDDPSAARIWAQNASQSLDELMLELQQKEQEWVECRKAALSAARLLGALLDCNAQVEVFDMEEQPTGTCADTEFWTQGKLTLLKSKVQDVIERIESETSVLSTSELQRLVQTDLPLLNSEIDDLIKEARTEFLSAQLRFEMADLVVEEIEANMFSCEGGTYEGQDMRAAYVTKLTHRDGGEVTIRIAPVKGKVGINSLEIHSYDTQRLEPEELDARHNGILDALSARGLRVNEGECIAKPDPSLRNLREVEEMPSPVEQALTARKRS